MALCLARCALHRRAPLATCFLRRRITTSQRPTSALARASQAIAAVPCSFAVAYGGLKTAVADAMVQKWVEGADELDRRRIAVFLAFGFVQVGFVQYQIYVNLFTRLFPTAGMFSNATIAAKLADPVGLRNLSYQVALDQFIYHPLCYFPVFYTCKEVIQGTASGPVETVGSPLPYPIRNLSR